MVEMKKKRILSVRIDDDLQNKIDIIKTMKVNELKKYNVPESKLSDSGIMIQALEYYYANVTNSESMDLIYVQIRDLLKLEMQGMLATLMKANNGTKFLMERNSEQMNVLLNGIQLPKTPDAINAFVNTENSFLKVIDEKIRSKRNSRELEDD